MAASTSKKRGKMILSDGAVVVVGILILVMWAIVGVGVIWLVTKCEHDFWHYTAGWSLAVVVALVVTYMVGIASGMVTFEATGDAGAFDRWRVLDKKQRHKVTRWMRTQSPYDIPDHLSEAIDVLTEAGKALSPTEPCPDAGGKGGYR